jgi:hypothetical protein
VLGWALKGNAVAATKRSTSRQSHYYPCQPSFRLLNSFGHDPDAYEEGLMRANFVVDES